jgi:hypothetical protein
MSKAYEFSSNIIEIFDETEALYRKLNKQLSYYDILRNDILHKIELDKFNVSEGYILCKELKQVSQDRRLIKDELEPLHILFNSINLVKNVIEKSRNKISKIDKSRKYRKYAPRILKQDIIT